MGQCDGGEGGRVKEESADELTTAGRHSGTSFSTNSLLLALEYKYLTRRSSRLGYIMGSNPAKTVAQLKGVIRQRAHNIWFRAPVCFGRTYSAKRRHLVVKF